MGLRRRDIVIWLAASVTGGLLTGLIAWLTYVEDDEPRGL